MQPDEIKNLIETAKLTPAYLEKELKLPQSTMSKVIRGKRSLNPIKMAHLKRICTKAIKEMALIEEQLKNLDELRQPKPKEAEQKVKDTIPEEAKENIDINVYDLGQRFKTVCEAIEKSPEDVLNEIANNWMPKENNRVQEEKSPTPTVIPHSEDVREFPRPDNSLFKFL